MVRKLDCSYQDIIRLENLLRAWKNFLCGKRRKPDVVTFQLRLMDNILELQEDLVSRTYVHGGYKRFNISDPKPRVIHKATVRDRLIHHLLYQELYPYFDRQFIFDSYSCRLGKGVHKALYRFRHMARKVSRSNTRTCWVLKCDIKKFFASINQPILQEILKKYISDGDTMWLLGQVITSFHTDNTKSVGLPLGNLTSQLLVNIYMNEFDRFVKHELKTTSYVRYADDCLFLADDKAVLEEYLPKLHSFLAEHLYLSLHERKTKIQTLASGVDFLGWVHFPHHAVLRTTTKRRMLKNIHTNTSEATLASYLGMLRHGNAFGLRIKIEEDVQQLG